MADIWDSFPDARQPAVSASSDPFASFPDASDEPSKKPVPIGSDEEYANLPVGAAYFAPDGSSRTKSGKPTGEDTPAWSLDPVLDRRARDTIGLQPGDPGFVEQAMARQSARNPQEYDTQSSDYRKRYGAAAVTGRENFAAGAGKAVVDLGRGVRQIGAEVADAVSPRQRTLQDEILDRDPSRAAALYREQEEINARDSDLMSTGAGLAGNVTGNVATVVLPGSAVARGAEAAGLARTANVARALTAPNTYKAAAATGATLAALQPVATGESRLENAAIGGAFGLGGNAALNTVKRVAQPITRALSKEKAQAVRVLDEAGVPLDAAQRTGSKGAEVIKRAIDDNPLTGPGQKEFRETQQRAFTRAVLRTIGVEADAATDDVMGAAQARIGKVFDDVAERNPVRYDGRLNADLARIRDDVVRELPSNEGTVILNQIGEIFKKAQAGGGLIDGKAYQNLRTSLGRLSAQRSPLGYWAGQLRSTIDEALQRSANEADKAALKVARAQYRRMLQIEVAIDKEGSGQISAARLANYLGTKANRRASVYGRGDTALVRLAQAGKQLLPDKFPNSGTPARLLGQAALGAAAGAGVGAYQGDVSAGTLGGIALGAGGLAAARRVINNQRSAKLLSEGMWPGLIRNSFERVGNSRLLRNALAATGIANQRREE